MNFYNIDHHFCEGKILGMPEFLNSFSSLIFCFFGVYGLFFNKLNLQNLNIPFELNKINIILLHYTNSFIINFVYSVFVVIGIGSFAYHWTEQIGWALMDETPMIISIFTGLLYIQYTNFILSKFNSYNKYQTTNLTYKLEMIIYTYIMFHFMTINTMDYYRKLFPFFFGCILLLFYYKFINLINHFDKSFNTNITNIGIKQLITISISAIIWCFTEIFCKYNNNLILIIGHPLWHFIIAFGFYNIIQIIYFINFYTKTKSITNETINIYLSYDKYYLLYLTYNNNPII